MIILAIITTMGIHILHHFGEPVHWVNQSQHTLSAIQDAQTAYLAATTSWRAHLLLGNKANIPDFNETANTVTDKVRSLSKSLSDEPDQQHKLALLSEMLARDTENMRKSIELAIKNNSTDIALWTQRFLAQDNLAAVSTLVRMLKAGEQQLLDARLQARQADTHKGLFVLVLGNFAVAIIFLLTARLYWQEASRRWQIQETLQKHSAERQALYNDAPCGYHTLDSRGTLLEINSTELNWLGYHHDEIVGKMNLTEMLTPESIETFCQQHPILMEQGWLRDVALDMVRKDGTRLPVAVHSTAVWDESGNYVMSRSTVIDRTQELEALSDWRESEKRLQTIIDQTPAVIYLKDLEGKYRMINRRFENVFHVTRDEVVGKTDRDLFPEKFATKFRENDLAVIDLRSVLEREEIVPQNGALHTYVSKKFPIYDHHGTPNAVCCIATDVTADKLTRNEINALNVELKLNAAQLEAAHRKVEYFSHSISHELRPPLHAIDGLSRTLIDDYYAQLDDQARNLLQRVRDNAHLLQKLIDGHRHRF